MGEACAHTVGDRVHVHGKTLRRAVQSPPETHKGHYYDQKFHFWYASKGIEMLNEKSHAQKKINLTVSLCIKLVVTRGGEDTVAKEAVKSQLWSERRKITSCT